MTEIWRYRCPEGHVDVRHRSRQRIYCRSCDQHYEQMRDAKTDQLVERSDRSPG